MSRTILIARISTRDIVSIPLSQNHTYKQVSATYLAGRFGVTDIDIENIVGESTTNIHAPFFDIDDGVQY